ncbi:MAG TPA: hypothetical protein VLT88_10685, partial [Desulfosarcina sp.]|nr:hypothetical protein [Desulfosarcina sp.]
MITREHLQAAVAAIHAVDPETGFGLKMLLDQARIKAPATDPSDAHDSGTRSFPYYFDGQRVDIPKTAFVARGIPVLEQSLVFQLGELRAKQSRAAAWISGNVRQLVGDIRRAGAAAVVDHELRRMPVPPAGLDAPLRMPDPESGGPHFSGHLATGQPGRFIPLPLN